MASQFVRAPGPSQPRPAAPGGIPPDAAAMVSQQQPSSAARHVYRQPTDKNISEVFDSILPEVELYRKLQDVEKKLDSTISRKKLDLQDMAARSIKKTKVLRVFISNTAIDQPWQNVSSLDTSNFGFDSSSPDAMWNLRIEGRLVDDEPADSPTRPKFNTFFTSIIVELEPLEDVDTTASTDSNVIEWHMPAGAHSQGVEFDVLDIRRKGDTNRKAKISLVLKEFPDKFKLSPKLSELLAIDEATKAGVVVAMWQYIKFHELQDDDEKRLIRCNADLKEILGRETISFPQIMDLLAPHLLQRQPIVIDYTIRVDKESTLGEAVYDIDIEMDDPRSAEMNDLLENWFSDQAAIAALDDQIAAGVQSLNNSRLQRHFYSKLAENPADFIERWVASQVQDLKVITSDEGFEEETVRQSGFYSDDLLRQSAFLFLNAKP